MTGGKAGKAREARQAGPSATLARGRPFMEPLSLHRVGYLDMSGYQWSDGQEVTAATDAAASESAGKK